MPTGWSDRLDRLRDRLGIGRAVDLFVSPGCEVPTVIGWVRPAILVPASALTGLSTAELESILAHELAHVRRHDYAINLLQCVAETLLFYHPCARWASRVIRQEREHCCDDLAVAACGDRLTYARALASMEGLRGPAFNLSPAANGGTLLARVRRVLNPKEEPMKPIKILGLLASMAIAPAWLAGVAAQQPDTPAPPLAPAAPTPTADVEAAKFVLGEIEIKGHRRLKVTQTALAAREQGAATRQARPADGPSRKAIDDQGPPEDPVIALEPPTEAEIWEKIPKSRPEAPTFYEVHRDNARFLVEKIGTNVDPVKVYPLAGPCQLVHAHYKATVWFDETYRADHPIPFTHTRHRAEVVFIDKDFLIRAKGNQAVAPAEQPAEDVDRKIERLSREIEELRQSRRRERDERKRELDRLNNERVEPEGKPVR